MASCMTLRASLGVRGGRVLVHQPGQQLLVEAAPVDADAHRLGVLQRQLDDGRELPVALVLEADVAGIDAPLGERLGAGGVLGQQRVAVVVEVADQGHARRPSAPRRSRMRGTALAASSRSTVMRTISEPARARSAVWRAVASTSAVSVLVIDCTTMGALPPMTTPPTLTGMEARRGARRSVAAAISCVLCAMLPHRAVGYHRGSLLLSRQLSNDHAPDVPSGPPGLCGRLGGLQGRRRRGGRHLVGPAGGRLAEGCVSGSTFPTATVRSPCWFR